MFSNLPFPSAIAANFHPEHFQTQQSRNLSIPIWAVVLLINTTVTSLEEPIKTIFQGLQKELRRGTLLEEFLPITTLVI
jgi:hypothetical protein